MVKHADMTLYFKEIQKFCHSFDGLGTVNVCVRYLGFTNLFCS